MGRTYGLGLSVGLVCIGGCDVDENTPQREEPGTDITRDYTPPEVPIVRPPPLSGGTLLASRHSDIAVVSDPERDRLLLVSLPVGPVTELELTKGDEPGRIVEDDQGHAHVILRGGGAVATVDLKDQRVIARRKVCSAPRGIAFDRTRDLLHVVCASGELVQLDSALRPESIAKTILLEPDLRDVVVLNDRLIISTMRGAGVLVALPDGTVVHRDRPQATYTEDLEDGSEVVHEPSTAWRMIPDSAGAAMMVHSVARSSPIDLDPEVSTPYGGNGCTQPVQSAVSFISATGVSRQVRPTALSVLQLPVDIAAAREGGRFAVVDAGLGVVREFARSAIVGEVPCSNSGGEIASEFGIEQPVAADYGADGLLLVQTREPSTLSVHQNGALLRVIELGGEKRTDTGYDLFHGVGTAVSLSGLSCASCHPEGRDDGHVWTFTGVGPRRTPSLAGTLKGTAPFHWEGDLETLDALMDEVMVRRMGAGGQSPQRVKALRTWLEEKSIAVRPAKAFADAMGSAERGRALFDSAETGCSSCHAGPMLTNNKSVVVGTTIEPLQTPSLVGVGMRAPFMHDGCASSLSERFLYPCGGGDAHGKTTQLSSIELADLVAFMTTL
jgi:hypothetical protein